MYRQVILPFVCRHYFWTKVSMTPRDFCFFPPMRSKGFLFNSGGWSRVRSALFWYPQLFATIRSMPAMRSLSLTVGRRPQSVMRMTCSRSIFSQIIAWFCCVSFFDMRGGSVCVLSGMHSTLCWCIVQSRGKLRKGHIFELCKNIVL